MRCELRGGINVNNFSASHIVGKPNTFSNKKTPENLFNRTGNIPIINKLKGFLNNLHVRGIINARSTKSKKNH
jgi:hypothetical protein